jgi:hypothetical protein
MLDLIMKTNQDKQQKEDKMIIPKNKELNKLVLWEDRGNTVLYKIENNALLFSHNLDQGGITFDIEDMQEVDFDLVGSEIDYRPILKKLGLNDEEVNQFMKKKNKISNDTIDKLTKMIIIENELGKFAFTYDNKNDLVYQQFEKNNQIYFSSDPNEGGNLSDDWEIVDMPRLDKDYIPMVNQAIKKLDN